MKKKLKSRRGLTLLEVLVAVILLTLLTAGGVTATSAVMASYNRMSEAAQAEILASTVIEALANEIRLGRNISVGPGGESITLDSVTFGEGSTFSLNPDGRLVVEVKGVTGQKQVLSESTYGSLKLTRTTASGATAPLFAQDPDPAIVALPGVTARTVYRITFTVAGQYSSDLCTRSTSAAPLTPAPTE